MKQELIETDCAVIGAGLAGCSAALELAEAGKKVDLFLKGKTEDDDNSNLLAGGLSAVPYFDIANDKDSYEQHVQDTLEAGKFLNDEKIVRMCVEKFYPEVIQWLERQGVKFDDDLHREGGHSADRIFHIKDTTGKSIMEVLREKVRKHKNITVHPHHIAIDLITKNKRLGKPGTDACLGVYLYDIANDKVKTVKSNATFIATGGIGKVFLYTSNSDVASSDGYAICYRVGLPLSNMEFIQFHPTVFYDPNAVSEGERIFLLTEALRGAGAFLKINKDSSEDFVLKYDEMGSKATRDVVSRAEDQEMRANDLQHVWLDCTKIPSEKLKKDFKNSYDFCLSKGFDLTKEPLPVVYAEHYSNGGVLVGDSGQTSIPSLYVVGETAYTGLHGATRLASNSGPECVLFGRRAAEHFLQIKKFEEYELPLWDPGRATLLKDKLMVTYYWEMIRRTMNSLCGMVRNKQRLEAGLAVIGAAKEHIGEYFWQYFVTKDFLEVRNIADTAEVILRSALAREETRACHYREDFPETKGEYKCVTTIERYNLDGEGGVSCGQKS